jgi:hypothetical protein
MRMQRHGDAAIACAEATAVAATRSPNGKMDSGKQQCMS